MIAPKAYFPVLVTDKIDDCKRFFVSLFGFEPVFDTDWYVHLVHGNGSQLGFLVPDHPSQPALLQSQFSGSGMIYSFEVDDVDDAFDQLQDRDLEIVLKPKTEDWGQRHFLIAGPGGLIVDVVQNMDPSLDAT